MAKGLVTGTSLKNIAESIRLLNGSENTYTPAQMDTAIIDAIPTEEASGKLVHITDAAAYPAKECVTVLEPKQDLHGYDAPWIGGNGKNLAPPLESFTAYGVSFNINDIGIITLTGTATANANIVITSPIQLFSGYMVTISIENSNISYGLSGYGVGTYTIEPSFDYLSDGMQIRIQEGIDYTGYILKPQLELGSTATSYEPYSNICPIEGYTGAELVRTGKNLLEITAKSQTLNGVAFTVNKDSAGNNVSITVNGTAANDTYFYLYGMTFPDIIQGKTVILSGGKDNVRLRAWHYDGGVSIATSENGNETTPITINNTSVGTIDILIPANTTVNTTIYPMVRLATDTNDTYEPYQGSTHTADWQSTAGTVYGCEVDWVNGVLSSEWAEIISYNDETLPDVWLSDRDIYAPNTTPTIGAQVIYKLTTPIEYPLTPEIIRLLKGENNLWADNEKTSVTYKVNLATYIQELKTE